MDSHPQTSIFAEYKQALSNLRISLCSESFSDVSPGDNSLEISTNTVTDSTVEPNVHCNLMGLQINPSTCWNLQVKSKGEIHFTIDAKRDEDTLRIDEIYSGSQQSKFVQQIKTYQDKCYCKMCGQKVIKNSCLFLRVLPLPSENWSDFSDIWFCHKHDHTTPNEKHKSGNEHCKNVLQLRPKEQDCLVAESYFLILSIHVKDGNVGVKNNEIRCGRCHAFVGEICTEKKNGVRLDNEVCKIYKTGIVFYNKDTFLTEERHLLETGSEDQLARLLLEHSRLYTCFKFFISATPSYKSFECLMWLIDPNSCFYQGILGNERTILKPCHAVKLLYKTTFDAFNRSTENIPDWKTDDSVHMIQLPYVKCLRMLKILIESTAKLPTSIRRLDGFYVGYLKFTLDYG